MHIYIYIYTYKYRYIRTKAHICRPGGCRSSWGQSKRPGLGHVLSATFDTVWRSGNKRSGAADGFAVTFSGQGWMDFSLKKERGQYRLLPVG